MGYAVGTSALVTLYRHTAVIQDLEDRDVPTATALAERWVGPGRIVAMAFGAVLGTLVILGLASVQARGITPPAIACAGPTPLVRHPTDPAFTGAPLGPLLLRNFAPDEARAIIAEYTPGYATKVVTVAARPFDRPLTLSGWRCSDRHPLRFAWTYPFTPPSRPASLDKFDVAGERDPVVQPMPSLPSTGVFGPAAPAYFLFSSTGDWVIELRDADVIVGRAVLEVQQH